MPLYMDVHTVSGGVGMDDVAKAHIADLQTQGRHDVSYLRYWVDERHGKIFCLVEAPSADAAPVNVFGQDGTRAQAVIQGRLTVSLPPRAAGAMFANSIRYQIDRSAVVDFRARRPLVPGSRFRS